MCRQRRTAPDVGGIGDPMIAPPTGMKVFLACRYTDSDDPRRSLISPPTRLSGGRGALPFSPPKQASACAPTIRATLREHSCVRQYDSLRWLSRYIPPKTQTKLP